ncbi:hypothetical protein CANMA_001814 [Candida margitis]|uniref:uncharacterized protein n=1 Tax=Candida margitis TaxID=1775924 RepID=UPI002227D15A|nr:uncharacterized protein CANMA_001814 [Candida margitis]KAI5969147.1 hypothetical protein CANMA_001814 [Candida margitis]
MTSSKPKKDITIQSSQSQVTTSVKKKSLDQGKSSTVSNKLSQFDTNSTSSKAKTGTPLGKEPNRTKSSLATTSVSLHSQSHEVVYKIFTYIVIILPTLTSIIFPINTKSIPQNEQIGNFIIDLLTVVLISWIVRFTLEWPYNWMKELETTRTKLLQQLTEDDFAIEHTNKVIMMVRKINTFQIMALVCCLVSSLLSSVLLIWTRKYTIIDQKRKKMVFNNVNIALLQFWSIFRIIITFTDSLQYSSLNNSNSPLYTQSPSFQTWFSDLKQYFLPNLTNQILLDHLQVHNKQFDRLKLDLIKLQKELDKRDQTQAQAQQNEYTQYQKSSSSSSSRQKELSAHGKLQPKIKQAQSQHPLLVPSHNNTSSEQQMVYMVNNSFPPFPLGVSPPKLSPLFSPMQTEFDYSQLTPTPSLQKHHSFSQTPLKTIVEEEDLIFESLEPPSFNKFESQGRQLSSKTILERTRSVLQAIRNEITIHDLVNNPKSVRKVLVTKLAFLMNEYKSSDNEILKVFFMEVIDKYLLGIYVQIMDHLVDLIYHPFHYLLNAIIWSSFKLPLYVAKLYFKMLLTVPILLAQWVMIKPVKFVASQISSMVKAIFSLVLFIFATEDAPTPQPADVFAATGPNHLAPSPQKPTNFKPMSRLYKTQPDPTQFTMKQFHLSPVLSKDEYFTKNFDQETKAQAKYKNASLISITPSSSKSSSISNGNIPRQSLKLNSAVLYDD